MSLRSPLGRVLGLGTAKDGTEHWWAQRMSAVALAVLGLWFAWSLASMPGFDHAAATAFISGPANSILLLLLSTSMAYHSYRGVQVVIEDYVHAPGVKVVVLVLSRFAHITLAVAAIFAIFRIGLVA